MPNVDLFLNLESYRTISRRSWLWRKLNVKIYFKLERALIKRRVSSACIIHTYDHKMYLHVCLIISLTVQYKQRYYSCYNFWWNTLSLFLHAQGVWWADTRSAKNEIKIYFRWPGNWCNTSWITHGDFWPTLKFKGHEREFRQQILKIMKQ